MLGANRNLSSISLIWLIAFVLKPNNETIINEHLKMILHLRMTYSRILLLDTQFKAGLDLSEDLFRFT